MSSELTLQRMDQKAAQAHPAVLLNGTPFRVDLVGGKKCRCRLAQDKTGSWECISLEVIAPDSSERIFWAPGYEPDRKSSVRQSESDSKSTIEAKYGKKEL
jgi:hypothetical protein